MTASPPSPTSPAAPTGPAAAAPVAPPASPASPRVTLPQRLHARRTELILFFTMSSLYFFAVFHRISVPGTIFDELQIGFSASAAQVTRLSAIALYIYAAMQIPVGLIADRWGGGRPMLIAGVVMAAGFVALPLAPSLGALTLAVSLVSLGSSFMFLCLLKEIEEVFAPRSFAPLVGVLLLVGYMGGMAGTSPLARATHALGWRTPMMVAAGLCVLALVASVLMLRGSTRPQPRRRGASPALLLELARTRGAWAMIYVGPAGFAAYLIMQATLGKKFLQDYGRLSPAQAADAVFAMLVVVVVGSFIAGFLPRLIGQRRKPIVIAATTSGLLGSALLLAGVTWALPTPCLIAGYLLLAACCTIGAVTTTLFKEICPTGATALAAGVLNSTSYIAVGLANQVAGLVLDAYKDRATHTPTAVIYPPQAYRAIFALMVAITGAALLVSLLIPETFGRPRATDPARS